ncbi:hypothetical protein V8G54_001849 [Vigna mungo]|uniref:Uncharacterized protein n=1 Tax=Vigna mungo TaxID=3915 RepID=A0AAQ3P938_VIGMU
MVKPEAAGGAGGGRKDPLRDKISNLPWSVTTAPEEAGCLRVTLVTVPVPLKMQTPLWRFLANSDTLSTMSQPSATSIMWVLMALALSRVMIMGGLGLFLEPAGLPRGLLVISASPAPSSLLLPLFSSRSLFCALLLPLFSSSVAWLKVWNWCCCGWWCRWRSLGWKGGGRD